MIYLLVTSSTTQTQTASSEVSVGLGIASLIGLAGFLVCGVYGARVVYRWMKREQVQTYPFLEYFVLMLSFMFGVFIVIFHLPYAIYKWRKANSHVAVAPVEPQDTKVQEDADGKRWVVMLPSKRQEIAMTTLITTIMLMLIAGICAWSGPVVIIDIVQLIFAFLIFDFYIKAKDKGGLDQKEQEKYGYVHKETFKKSLEELEAPWVMRLRYFKTKLAIIFFMSFAFWSVILDDYFWLGMYKSVWSQVWIWIAMLCAAVVVVSSICLIPFGGRKLAKVDDDGTVAILENEQAPE